MVKDNYTVIGVMSGTSLDGIDLALISFKKATNWSFKIEIAQTVVYPKTWLNRLKNLINLGTSELNELDEEYTTFLASVINNFIKTNNISNIDAVCSHGHTALHRPELGYTLQIGNLPQLSNLIKQTVVCDFRIQDVELGGQGAPLVPIGDQFLFPQYHWCLNFGGFANISSQENTNRIAFDICPVNIVLNKYVGVLGFDFDVKGILARQGIFHHKLFNQLNQLAFYYEKAPKSLGLEWVKTNIFPLVDSYNLPINDVLHTYVKHIAFQIAKVINQKQNTLVLATGGGVFNDFLLEEITKLTSNQIIIPSKNIIEFKEALIFGFLGILKLRGENNCLKSVTGALKDHSSGKIFNIKK